MNRMNVPPPGSSSFLMEKYGIDDPNEALQMEAWFNNPRQWVNILVAHDKTLTPDASTNYKTIVGNWIRKNTLNSGNSYFDLFQQVELHDLIYLIQNLLPEHTEYMTSRWINEDINEFIFVINDSMRLQVGEVAKNDYRNMMNKSIQSFAQPGWESLVGDEILEDYRTLFLMIDDQPTGNGVGFGKTGVMVGLGVGVVALLAIFGKKKRKKKKKK